jgi:hypothetical protein
MQTEESQKERFFEALHALKEQKDLHGISVFAKKYGANLRNFWLLEQNKKRNLFQLSWFTDLVNDYGVSAEWLITGKGKMFKKRGKIQKKNEYQENTPIHP